MFFAGVYAALMANAQVGTELIANGDFSKLDEPGWVAGGPRGRSAHIEKDAAGNRLVLECAGAAVNLKIPNAPQNA